MDMMTRRSNRGSGASSNAMGSRRWPKRNMSTSTMASLNTNSNSTRSYPRRPSPVSSASDRSSYSSGDLIQPSPTISRIEPSSRKLRPGPSEHERKNDSGFGLMKKLSRPGTRIGKGAGRRRASGPRRSQSDASLILSNEEAIRMLDEIREKAAKDTARAMDHTINASIHPTRQRSLFTPGLATRNPDDPLRKQGQYEARRAEEPIEEPPASAPLYRPSSFSISDYMQSPIPPYEVRLNALGLIGGDDVLSRASTPSEYDYGRLGSGLRIMNGISSPDPSIGRPSPHPGHKKSLTTAYGGYLDHKSGWRGHFAPYDQSDDYFSRATTPLQSRLYAISNASYANGQRAKQDTPLAPGELVPRSSQLARKYMSDLKSSPFEPDLNKPLPIPPPPSKGNTPVILQAETPYEESLLASRSNLDRSDLAYRRREPLQGDLSSRQDSLIDETLTLLDSIGSLQSGSSKPQTTTTVSTSTTFSTSTAPDIAQFKQFTTRPQVPLPTMKSGGPTTITTTTPTVSVTHTKLSPREADHKLTMPIRSSLHSTTTTSSTSGPSHWQQHETDYYYSNSPTTQTGIGQIPPPRHDDSGYNSSMSHSSTEANQPQMKGHSRTASSFETSSRRPPLKVRPIHPNASRTGRDGFEISSAFSDSSEEMTTTLTSLRGAVNGTHKRRLKKNEKNEKARKGSRPTSLPPSADRIHVQGQKLYYSGFIPHIPQDLATRHAQRGKDFPPLAETVPPVQKTNRSSDTGDSPPTPPRKNSQLAQPKATRRTSRVFHGRFLDIGYDTAQASDPEIATAPCHLNENTGIYGSSPNDPVSSSSTGQDKSQGAWDTVHPALRPTPYFEDKIDAWASYAPQTAPPSQQHFDNHASYHNSTFDEYHKSYRDHHTYYTQPAAYIQPVQQPTWSGQQRPGQYSVRERQNPNHVFAHRRNVSEQTYNSSNPTSSWTYGRGRLPRGL